MRRSGKARGRANPLGLANPSNIRATPIGGLPPIGSKLQWSLRSLLFTACATPTVRLDRVVPPGTADLALSPYPTPHRAELHDRLRPFDVRLVVFESLPDAPAGSFEIVVTEEGIRVASADPAARRWAMVVLDQMSVDRSGDRFVRMGHIRDRPSFPLRGSKRLLSWELAYRANLSYERPFPGVTEVAVLSPGGVLDATEAGVGRARAFFREVGDAGVRHFSIEFDDVGFGLTQETKDRFGSYPRAIAHYLAACRKSLDGMIPDATLYWLPQTYWTDCERLETLAYDIGLRGGLPKDLGLVLTGPDVISAEILAKDIVRARRAFGLTRTKVLVYDNLGREGDHGPLRGRGPDLLAVADAVFGERGEPLHRLTRLDYAWNPVSYDPERSHVLACREIVGAAAAVPLSRFIRIGPRLSATERLSLYREAVRMLAPPMRAPVPAAAYLPRIWRDVVREARLTGGSP